MKPDKLLQRLQKSQTSIRFSDLIRLVEALGFVLERTKGSHRIYIHPRRREAQLNLQPDGSEAKPYQVKQLLRLVEEYNLQLEESD